MTAPKVVILDVSCEEAHEELVECIDDIDYAIKEYGNNPSYAIYMLYNEVN